MKKKQQSIGLINKQLIKELKKIVKDRKLTVAVACHVAPNGNPEQMADWDVWRSAKMRVKIDRYRALNIGRTYGSKPYFEIWKERADVLWAENV